MECKLLPVFLIALLCVKTSNSNPVTAYGNAPGCKNLLDVVAVVDGSDSIAAHDFSLLKLALESLVTDLNVQPDNTRFGVVLFSANVTARLDLTGNGGHLVSGIRNLVHPRDGTNTALAIAEMNDMVSALRRPGVPVVGIVITDGISKDPIATVHQATISKDIGINMFAIGVGDNIDELELMSIASNGQMLTTSNFGQIRSLLGNLVQVVCPTTTTSTTTTTTPAPTTTTTTTTTTTPAPTTTTKPDPCDNCKMSNGVGYNPHPVDCTKYFQCEFGAEGLIGSVVRQCPHGLFWDQNKVICNYPSEVQCANDPCLGIHANNYVYKNGGNCRQYYTCVNGSSTGQCCGRGFAFVSGQCVASYECSASCESDVIDRVCDKRPVNGNKHVFEQLVSDSQWVVIPCAPGTAFVAADCKCSVSADIISTSTNPTPTTTTTTTTTTPAPTTTTTTTTTPAPTTTTKPDPCDNCKMSNGIGYNPHPVDCTKYFQCEFGAEGLIGSVVRQCPHGLFWDQNKVICNYPSEVQCANDPCLGIHANNYVYKNGGNCRQYYTCVNGSSTGQCCARGFAFLSGQCVASYECSASCESDIIDEEPGCKNLLDVVAVVDGSDSIAADDFVLLKLALESLVTDLNVQPDNTRFGVVLFSANVTARLDLSGDAGHLVSGIRNLRHPRDGTNTALAIAEMNDMVSALRRPGVPVVGIVITDGISKDPIATTHQATISKDLGINMFAIGVGDNVDELELMSIASNGQMLTTSNFGQIGNLLGNLVQVVCPTTTTSTTTTTTPAPTTTTTTTTTPAPTTTTKPDPCDNCKMSNGVGYNPHPVDCTKYFQCEFGAEGLIGSVVRQCPHGLFWDQNKLTCNYPSEVQCVNDPCSSTYANNYLYKNGGNCRQYYTCVNGSSTGQCCARGFAFISGQCVASYECNASCESDVIDEVCDKRPVNGNKHVFEQLVSDSQWVVIPCAPGTAFVAADCKCSVSADVIAISTNQCRRVVYLPFDNDVSDQSGNGNYVENEGVVVSNGVAYFDGKSVLRIPRFSNVEFGSKLIISLKYQSEGAVYGQEAIISNGDCGKSGSILVALNERNVLFGLRTVNGNIGSFKIPSATGWNSVVYKVKGNKFFGLVNSVESVQNVEGAVIRSQCALQVGRGTSLNSFRGYLDELTVYMC